MKRTPLYDQYCSMPKVKLIDFGGWELPVNFEAGILAEHHAVRNAVGLFDISHMGECIIRGHLAATFLDYLVTNTVVDMTDGQIIYALMCYPDGTVVDDLIIYRIDSETYWVVMNAANIEKDLRWITKENPWSSSNKEMPEVIDYSDQTAQMALQGPSAISVIGRLCPEGASLGFFRFLPEAKIASKTCILSRNGYTGEDGFEIYCKAADAPVIWNALLTTGKDFNILPCGLGARDTLRLEAKLPLYGHEISDTITPLEANLGVFVRFDKPDFCGQQALKRQEQSGVPRSLRGFEMIDAAVPRNGYRVFLKEKDIGYVTSGTKSPTLGIFCGYMLIDRDTGLKFGDEIDIEIHGKKKRAKLVKTPFYKKTPKK